ncbi:MAG TPA: tRNA (guanosine(46)-N7)-methyltransferase TrmB [Anaerohalosphaeraceae bacterium]|nr:tRNA (guanosine(46)-N7)-methyltransferase TrmB [Anaerohalosphaeraceae bacterium]HPO70950.1 tRNA (guanosine(46)-N7)-methyltransferase TrmB [Anaerohalosphaeraceae bacterium]
MPEELNGMIDFSVFFGHTGPVELEIGSGRGTFLVSQAAAFAETHFLGIEWAAKFWRYAVDRIGRRGLDNVRLIRTDAAAFIRQHIPDASIRMVHLYFPDPWPKKRHHKRRFFCDENLCQLYRILEPDGIINTATDHADYFEQMTIVAERAVAQGLFEQIPFIRPAGAQDGETVGTNYERKYRKEGRRTYTLALRKR